MDGDHLLKRYGCIENYINKAPAVKAVPIEALQEIKGKCEARITGIDAHWLDYRSPSEAKSGYEWAIQEIDRKIKEYEG